MSAALASHGDISSGSNGTHPEISLGSLASGFSTPGRHLRIPSISSRSTAPSSLPLATPSPPTSTSVFSRRKSEGFALSSSSRFNTLSRDDHTGDDVDDAAGGDLLDTPAVDKKRYGEDVETPRKRSVATRASTAGTKGVTLTLRDQEKVRSFKLFSTRIIH